MTTQMQVLAPHLDDPPARGAAVAALVSALGMVISLRVTWLKFRVDNLCDATGCTGDAQATWLACDEALASPWSTVAGIPVTIYSAALFAVTLGLAIDLLRRRGALWPAARPLLGLCAALATVASAAFVTHAALHFTRLCPYCLAIYAVTAVLVVVATRLCVATRAWTRWLAAVRARSQAVLDATLLALTIGVLTCAFQVAVYRLAARDAACPAVAVSELPPAPTIRHHFGGETRDIVLLFADPSCATCRRELSLVRQSLVRFLREGPAHAPWSGVELWAYPTPLEPCDDATDAGWFVDRAGRPLTSSDAARHNACLAARAVECAASRDPQRGLEALTEIYSLHDSPPPYFTYDKLRFTLARGAASRPEDDRLRGCIDSPRTTARIDRYQRLFAELCQSRTACTVPHALIIPVVAGVPRPDLATAADSARKLLGTLQLSDPTRTP
jgi:uncharacterized membrane protein